MQIKGTAVRSVIRAIEGLYGEDQLARVLAAVPDAARAELEPAVLGTRWYPIAIQAALHEAIRTQIGRGRTDANYAVGRRGARDDFQGVYRVFLRLATYDAFWEKLPRVWPQYNSRGTLSFIERRPGLARVRIEGTDGYALPMWVAIAGRFDGLLELAGARAIKVAVEEHSDTASNFRAEWQ